MMLPCSQSPRSLVVPGIGFCQSIPVGPDVSDFVVFRAWSLTAPRKQAADATDQQPKGAADPRL